tara:strand:- start:1540 stop:1962 length:423 start_codon:yes stop_codon:yes gene_type:complete
MTRHIATLREVYRSQGVKASDLYQLRYQNSRWNPRKKIVGVYWKPYAEATLMKALTEYVIGVSFEIPTKGIRISFDGGSFWYLNSWNQICPFRSYLRCYHSGKTTQRGTDSTTRICLTSRKVTTKRLLSVVLPGRKAPIA